MNRNIAFFISSNNENNNHFVRAKKHFINLANRFYYQFVDFKKGNFNIFIIFEGKFTANKYDSIEFSIGNLGTDYNKDRYLTVLIKECQVIVCNDYAGSIPVYFSKRKYISLSNIEPCVMLDSGTMVEDLSYENIYGFLRYSHFIWDETAYRHIFNMKPDSEYRFNSDLKILNKKLDTINFRRKKIKYSNNEVANDLRDLNNKLVSQSLKQYSQIILPLSSGYDSRMILAAISETAELREKTYCFTYGSIGSIEVESGRRLAQAAGVRWDFVDLPTQFLEKPYLTDIYDIFGSSLHMHGMYQFEFWNEICKKMKIGDNACLTSGFMTGVPAGQHISKLKIKHRSYLNRNMNKFPQSQYWKQDELEKNTLFRIKNCEESINQRFQASFDRVSGDIDHKSVLFDIWTRQRNFISYYPRTLEWKIPVISPHMNVEYINFFMSLSPQHLQDRRAVELMFAIYYPELAIIASNSNGLKCMTHCFENYILFLSQVFKFFKINSMLPQKYKNNNFDFDISALQKTGKKAIYPILSEHRSVNIFLDTLIPQNQLQILYNKAQNGNTIAYQQLVTLQSLGFSVLHMNET